MPCLALIPFAAAAALGSWTYGGFLTEPPRAATRTATVSSNRPDPTPARPVVPATSVAPPLTAAPPPTRYRLADATGQVWEHADPTWLQTFVASRNALMFRPLGARSSCTSGTCR